LLLIVISFGSLDPKPLLKWCTPIDVRSIVILLIHWSMLLLVGVHFGHPHQSYYVLFKLLIHVFAFLSNEHTISMNTPYQSYYVVSDCLFLSHLFGHITITLGWFVSSSPKLLSCFIWPLSKMLCRSSFETTLLLLLLSSQNSWPNTKKCFGSPKKLKRGGAYQHHLPIIIKVNKKTPKPLIAKIG
jgi:hypothetical protein